MITYELYITHHMGKQMIKPHKGNLYNLNKKNMIVCYRKKARWEIGNC